MKHIIYVSLTDGFSERVDALYADPVEVAAVIDRALLPLAKGAECGYANARRSIEVRGELGSKRSTLALTDGGEQIAVVVVCLHSRASSGAWRWLHDHSPHELPDMREPAAPWVAMRYDCAEGNLPRFIDAWAKNVGVAILQRKGW